MPPYPIPYSLPLFYSLFLSILLVLACASGVTTTSLMFTLAGRDAT